jgi:NAD(P)H dehydrogenase (quinone)
MKTLIITAHPSTKGFTHKIAETIKLAREAKNWEVEIIDLYSKEYAQDFLRFEDKHDRHEDPVRDVIQKKITESSELVFIHPLWWVNVPAVMKNFLDNNISAGFAFKYINGKRVGLLGDKKAHLYITCDGPKLLYMLIGMPFWVVWRLGIVAFCGMKMGNFGLFDKKLFRSEDEQKAFLEKVRKSF